MPDLNTPANFDGWVMITEQEPGVLLMTDIAAIDLDRQDATDAPLCSGDHAVARSSAYELVSPEAVTYLCTPCVELLFTHREVGGFLLGALPAN